MLLFECFLELLVFLCGLNYVGPVWVLSRLRVVHRNVLVVRQCFLLSWYLFISVQVSDSALNHFLELIETVLGHEDDITLKQVCDMELLRVFHRYVL